jgi:uncharacterized repeat protein (TIGR04052 family)
MKVRSFRSSRLGLAAVGALLLGVPLTTSAATPPATATPERLAVAVRFRAVVGARPFACGQRYDSIGTAPSTFAPSDFRLFVHDVQLIARDGRRVPLALDADGRWQDGEIAMLDFEDGSGPCSNGTRETRDVITGSAPAGDYVGVSFTIGVPFARNHGDLTAQAPPLSVTRMFWSWNSGHKFIRLDGRTATGRNWVLHLGSTGCTPSDAVNRPPTSCTERNTVPVEFAAFDLARDTIVADVAALYRDSNLEANQPQTAAGCMSGPTDRDCAPIFRVLGLPFGDAPAAPQGFLRVERSAP